MLKLLKYNVVTTFLILASFVVLVSIPWNMCLPDGCFFSAPVCSDRSCISETLNQHIQERAQFLNVVVKTDILSLLIIALLLSFIMIGYFKARTTQFDYGLLNVKFKADSSSNLFNCLVSLFSAGILNPKIY